MRVAILRTVPPNLASDTQHRLILTGVGVAALLAMMAIGAVLARSRRIQVHELNEKLKSIDSDL